MKKILLLFYPILRSIRNRMNHLSRGRWGVVIFFSVFSLFFFTGLGYGIYRFLDYLHGVPLIGSIIIEKLVLVSMMSFFGFLTFSNIVTSISSYYLSDDMNLLMSLPVSVSQVHWMKYIETLVESSWMIIVFSLPLFIPVGIVFDAGWKYYVFISLMWPPFLVMPTAIGVILSSILINVFPARRIKEIFLALGFLTIFALLMMVLYLEPGRLIDPDRARSVAEYITSLRIPESSFLPSTWGARLISGLLRNDNRAYYYIALLWSNALVYLLFIAWLIPRIMRQGLTKAVEARTIRFSNNRAFEGVLESITARLSPPFRAILKKDLKILLRDASQWSQLVILLALVVIYLYAIGIYPLDMFESWLIMIQNTVSFLNIALVGFMISAVSIRFVFPAISLEGRSFWFVRTSPLTIRQLVASKVIIFGTPIYVLGLILVAVANWLLGVGNEMMIMSFVASIFVIAGVVSLTMAWGVANPEFKFENIARLSLGFNAITSIIISSTHIFICMGLLVLPISTVMFSIYTERKMSAMRWGLSFGCTAVFLAFSLFVIFKPISIAIRRLEKTEF